MKVVLWVHYCEIDWPNARPDPSHFADVLAARAVTPVYADLARPSGRLSDKVNQKEDQVRQ